MTASPNMEGVPKTNCDEPPVLKYIWAVDPRAFLQQEVRPRCVVRELLGYLTLPGLKTSEKCKETSRNELTTCRSCR